MIWILDSVIKGVYNLVDGFTNQFLSITPSNLIALDTMILTLYTTKKMIYNKDNKTLDNIIDRYNNLYNITWIKRIFMYNLLYWICFIFNNRLLVNAILVTFIIPNIQNKIIKINFLNDIHDKILYEFETIAKYLISKNIINYFRNIINTRIHNFNIFLLINVLTVDKINEWMQNFIFIWFMMILRSYETSYYYYKGIKLSYYYKTGYTINKIEKDEAKRIIKTMIDNREWESISKIEYVLPFYNLIYENYNCNSRYILRTIKYNIVKFFIIWTWTEFIINKIYTNRLSELILCLILYNTNTLIEIIIFYSTLYDSTTLLYSIISFNISLIIILRNQIMDIIQDIVFYIKNYNSIRIVMNHYNDSYIKEKKEII